MGFVLGSDARGLDQVGRADVDPREVGLGEFFDKRKLKPRIRGERAHFSHQRPHDARRLLSLEERLIEDVPAVRRSVVRVSVRTAIS